jgi:hypothetical protein
VPIQHLQPKVGRQIVGGPQLIERPAYHLRPDKRSGGHDKHRRVRQPQPLGGEHAAEVGLVANHGVRPPGFAQRKHLGHAPGGGASDKALPELLILAGGIERAEREPGRRDSGARAKRKHLKTNSRDRRPHRWPASEGNRMPGGSGCPRHGHEREKVPAPADEAEQDPHREHSRWAQQISAPMNCGIYPQITQISADSSSLLARRMSISARICVICG